MSQESDWIYPKPVSHGTRLKRVVSRELRDWVRPPRHSPPHCTDASTRCTNPPERYSTGNMWKIYSSQISGGDLTARNTMLKIREIQSVPPRSHPHTVLVPNGPHLYPLPSPSSTELRVSCCWGSIPLRKLEFSIQFMLPMLDISLGYTFHWSMSVCADCLLCLLYLSVVTIANSTNKNPNANKLSWAIN